MYRKSRGRNHAFVATGAPVGAAPQRTVVPAPVYQAHPVHHGEHSRDSRVKGGGGNDLVTHVSKSLPSNTPWRLSNPGEPGKRIAPPVRCCVSSCRFFPRMLAADFSRG